MMKKIVILLNNIVVLLVIFSFYEFGIANQTNNGFDSDTSMTPSSKASTHIVKMTGDYEFVPSLLTIKQGDSVEWVLIKGNHEIASGTVTEGEDGMEGIPDGLWDSGKMASGSFTYIFNSTGTFPYYCDSHLDQGMTGTIKVE